MGHQNRLREDFASAVSKLHPSGQVQVQGASPKAGGVYQGFLGDLHAFAKSYDLGFDFSPPPDLNDTPSQLMAFAEWSIVKTTSNKQVFPVRDQNSLIKTMTGDMVDGKMSFEMNYVRRILDILSALKVSKTNMTVGTDQTSEKNRLFVIKTHGKTGGTLELFPRFQLWFTAKVGGNQRLSNIYFESFVRKETRTFPPYPEVKALMVKVPGVLNNFEVEDNLMRLPIELDLKMIADPQGFWKGIVQVAKDQPKAGV